MYRNVAEVLQVAEVKFCETTAHGRKPASDQPEPETASDADADVPVTETCKHDTDESM